MSTHQSKTWLVAYDIRENRRRQRVHRLLRKQGLAAQYSAFTVEADDEQILALLQSLEAQIDTCKDDLRAYHLPASCPVWRLGTQHWPEGVYLAPAQAARLLMDAAQPAGAAALDPAAEVA